MILTEWQLERPSETTTIRKRKPIKCWDSFKVDLSNKDWARLCQTDDPNEQMEIFYSNFTEVLNKHSPYVTKQLRKNFKCILNKDTKEAMKERDATKKQIRKTTGEERQILLQKFRCSRNRALTLIRRDEKSSLNELMETDGLNNPWRVVDHVFGKGKKSSIALDVNKRLIHDDQEVSEIFRKSFIDKLETIRAKLPDKGEGVYKHIEKDVKDKNLNMSMRTLSEEEVSKVIKKLRTKSAKGLDDISVQALKACHDQLLAPLTYIINSSIVSGTFPKKLKESRISPLYKGKGSKTDRRRILHLIDQSQCPALLVESSRAVWKSS